MVADRVGCLTRFQSPDEIYIVVALQGFAPVRARNPLCPPPPLPRPMAQAPTDFSFELVGMLKVVVI